MKEVYKEKATKIMELLNGLTYEDVLNITILVRDITRTKAVLDNNLKPLI
jgi:hypothetical protein